MFLWETHEIRRLHGSLRLVRKGGEHRSSTIAELTVRVDKHDDMRRIVRQRLDAERERISLPHPTWLSLRSKTSAPAARATSAVLSLQLSATTSRRSSCISWRWRDRTVAAIARSSSWAGMTMLIRGRAFPTAGRQREPPGNDRVHSRRNTALGTKSKDAARRSKMSSVTANIRAGGIRSGSCVSWHRHRSHGC